MKLQKYLRWRSYEKSTADCEGHFLSGGLGSDLPEIKIKTKIKNGINILDLIAENKILPSRVKQEEPYQIKDLKLIILL